MSEPDDPPDAGDPTYAYKPSLMGAPWLFALRGQGLEWQVGRHRGLLRYDRIRRVRLSFRPVTLQSHRFLTEIWSSDTPKLQIASASWRSLTEQERLDAAYVAFVSELHRRLAAMRSSARFSVGTPTPIYWLGVVVFICAQLALAFMAVRTLLSGQWSAAALVGGFVLLFGWHLGTFFWRNQPGPYRPDALPPLVLPRV